MDELVKKQRYELCVEGNQSISAVYACNLFGNAPSFTYRQDKSLKLILIANGDIQDVQGTRVTASKSLITLTCEDEANIWEKLEGVTF